MIDYQQYIDEKMQQLRVVCQSQWDFLGYSELSNWLDDNFQNDIEGRYYATKIILHTVYYSKKALIKLLKYGLNEKIYGNIIKSDLIKAKNIYIPNSQAEGMVQKLKKSTFFIPLLDSNRPSESGNQIIGDLVHKLDIAENQVAFHWDITEDKLKGFKILVFTDDCIGSGSQLKKFWNSKSVFEIKEICTKYDIKVYFLALIGYNESLKLLQANNNLRGIEVIICDVLTNKNRVFSNDNIIWEKDSNERDKAIEYFEKMRRDKGINFLGFKQLDFAVILHDRLPNWSLPIFWRKNSSWKILIQRKTS